MAACSAVDVAQIATAIFTAIAGLAAVAAVVVAARQGRATAEVNRETMAGLRGEAAARAEERSEREQARAYQAWLAEKLMNRRYEPSISKNNVPAAELPFFERAVVQGYLIPTSVV